MNRREAMFAALGAPIGGIAVAETHRQTVPVHELTTSEPPSHSHTITDPGHPHSISAMMRVEFEF